jgi:hypothetical protein
VFLYFSLPSPSLLRKKFNSIHRSWPLQEIIDKQTQDTTAVTDTRYLYFQEIVYLYFQRPKLPFSPSASQIPLEPKSKRITPRHALRELLLDLHAPHFGVEEGFFGCELCEWIFRIERRVSENERYGYGTTEGRWKRERQDKTETETHLDQQSRAARGGGGSLLAL